MSKNKPILGNSIFKRKAFKDVKEGEFIYYINPHVQLNNLNVPFEELLKPTVDGQNQLIQPAKAKWVRGVPGIVALRRFVDIDYYRPENILHATDLAHQRVVTLRVNGEKSFWITMVHVENIGNMPIPYASTREELVAYIRKSYGR